MRSPSFTLGAFTCLLLVACGLAELSAEPEAGRPEGDARGGSEGGGHDAGEADLESTLPDSCPEPVDAFPRLGQQDLRCDEGRCRVPGGTYAGRVVFTADHDYVLEGPVSIGDGTARCVGRLEVEAGTRVLASGDGGEYLAVRPHSTIHAEGTAARPIVFGSERPEPGSWSGLWLFGLAPANCQDGDGGCSLDAGLFGGDTPGDSSGVLRYVRVEGAGGLIVPAGQPAALTLAGVGSDTQIDHVHVRGARWDGIELFGGTVGLRHVLVTGVGNDALDWSLGWQGRLQFAVAQQHAADGDNGIEADNSGNDPQATPRSEPILSHLTFVGSPNSTASDLGLHLRAGTGGQIWNAVVVGFERAGLDVDDAETFAHLEARAGNLTVSHSVLCNARNFEEDAGEPLTAEELFLRGGRFGWVSNEALDFSSGCNLGFSDRLFDEASPSFVPAAGSPLATGGETPNDPFFEPANYRGAVAPGTAEPWWGWTRFD